MSNEIIITSVQAFLDAIDNLGGLWKPKPATLFFRGQADYSWELLPSLYRDLDKSIANSKVPPYAVTRKFMSHEATALHQFQLYAPLFIEKTSQPATPLEWLILARHYGLYTRLLDLTNSALVALYFSCDAPDSSDGAVFILDPEWYNGVFHLVATRGVISPFVTSRDVPEGLFNLPFDVDTSKFSIDANQYVDPQYRHFFQYPVVIYPGHSDPRIRQQKSTFALFGSNHKILQGLLDDPDINKEGIIDHIIAYTNYWIDQTFPLDQANAIKPELKRVLSTTQENLMRNLGLQTRLAKLRVPSSKKKQIRSQLELCGITRADLFPGLEGITSDINERFLNAIRHLSQDQ